MKKLTILFLLIIISCSEKSSKIVEQPKRNIDLIFDKISKKYPNFENNPIASDDLKRITAFSETKVAMVMSTSTQLFMANAEENNMVWGITRHAVRHSPPTEN